MANPFEVAPPNALQALMLGVQGYDRGKAAADKATQDALYKQIGQQVQTGGIDNSALGQLFGLGPSAAPMLTAAAKLKEAQGANDTVYGTPIYGTTADGKTGIGTFNKAGQFKLIDTGGFQPTPGIRAVDTGTGTAIIDSRTGQPIGPPASIAPQRPGQPGMPPQVGAPIGARPQASGFIPKDVRGASYQGKEGAEQAQVDVALPEKRTKAAGALSGLNRKYNTVTNAIDAAAKSIDDGSGFSVPRAGVGAVLSGLPGTPQFTLAQTLKTIQANIGFDELQSMRENSPTGGALGAISDKENELLSLVRGSVVQGLDPQVLKGNLKRIKELYGEVLQERRDAFKRDFTNVPNRAPGSVYSKPAQQQAPQGDPLALARDAIDRGADRNAVIQRLRQNGIDPAGL
jgi:hypothetical protein